MTLEDHIIDVRYWNGKSANELAVHLNALYSLGDEAGMEPDEIFYLVFDDLLGNFDMAPLARFEFDIRELDWDIVGIAEDGRMVTWNSTEKFIRPRFFEVHDHDPQHPANQPHPGGLLLSGDRYPHKRMCRKPGKDSSVRLRSSSTIEPMQPKEDKLAAGHNGT